MRSYGDGIMCFAITYIVIVVSYIVLHYLGNSNEDYGFIFTGLLALLYLFAGIVLYFSFRKQNEAFAKGALWGVISVMVFLFTIGGCGVFR